MIGGKSVMSSRTNVSSRRSAGLDKSINKPTQTVQCLTVLNMLSIVLNILSIVLNPSKYSGKDTLESKQK